MKGKLPMKSKFFWTLTLSFVLTSCAELNLNLDTLMEGSEFNYEKGLSDKRIAEGLKEALRVGTDNTVSLTGRKDGYFANASIKIQMPEELEKVEKLLRKIKQGHRVDKFVLSMNRAAEAAAPEAKKIFIDAIMSMTFADVKKIYNGGDTAATDYFRDKTSAPIRQAFMPIVKDSTNKVGVTRNYKSMVKKTKKFTDVAGVKTFDPDEYVTDKAIEGLFFVLAEEERKIRKDPAARVTELLKEVFGRG